MYPSLYESFGGSCSSRRWRGCSVLGAIPALPEIVGGPALLFEPDDPEGLAMGIRGMVDDLELRQGYVERGRAAQGNSLGGRAGDSAAIRRGGAGVTYVDLLD